MYVYDSSGAFVTLAALRQGVASDVSYVQAQPGEYYLSVMSCAADWEIAVEDCSRSTRLPKSEGGGTAPASPHECSHSLKRSGVQDR